LLPHTVHYYIFAYKVTKWSVGFNQTGYENSFYFQAASYPPEQMNLRQWIQKVYSDVSRQRASYRTRGTIDAVCREHFKYLDHIHCLETESLRTHHFLFVLTPLNTLYTFGLYMISNTHCPYLPVNTFGDKFYFYFSFLSRNFCQGSKKQFRILKNFKSL